MNIILNRFYTGSLKTDKGKLPVRAGRKAMGHLNGDCQVPEVFNTLLRIFTITNTNPIHLNRCLNQNGSDTDFHIPVLIIASKDVMDSSLQATKRVSEVSYGKNTR